ncbi:MAG: hypothetical protein E7A62_07055 [Actinomycetaceae bacterium]|nr:hypothetical protein [Actinomycetaceae bacterium]MDU0970736.1 hypothetical protein [Actinomycetaceae bacterium]
MSPSDGADDRDLTETTPLEAVPDESNSDQSVPSEAVPGVPGEDASATENPAEDVPTGGVADAPDPNRKRSRIIIGVVVALVVIAAVVIGICAAHGGHGDSTKKGETTHPAASATTTTRPSSPSPSDSSASSTPTGGGDEDVPQADQEAAGTVLSEAPKNLDAHVADGAKEQYGYSDASQVMPEGTTLEVDKSTWTRVDDNTILVKVTITRPNEQPTAYTAIMARESADSEWKIVGTVPYDQDGK